MKTKQSGAILLIAIMVSSVVLAVGFGIYQRTYKQILIGSFWKQIQIAFAAADAGLECAVYWDKKYPNPTGSDPASCFGINFVWDVTLPIYSSPTYTEVLSNPGGSGSTGQLSVQGGCVEITVGKINDPDGYLLDPPRPLRWTYIETAGYNDACTSASPRRVNRIRWITHKD